MSDAYRQKLHDWFCSALLVVTFASLSLLADWIHSLPILTDNDTSPSFVDVMLEFADSILFYPIMFPVILFWHFWDFAQRETLSAGWRQRVSGYCSFLSSLIALNLFGFLEVSGLFTINSCDALEGALHFECFISSPSWLSFSFLVSVLLALSLCLAKAVISISSNFTKAA